MTYSAQSGTAPAGDIARLLAAQPLLRGLPQAFLERSSTFTSQIEAFAGDIIFEEGAPADTLYILLDGKVALSTHAPGKGHLLVQTLGPGELLGLSWLFAPYRWQFRARAVEAVRALAVQGAALRAALDSDPALGYEVLKRVTPVVLQRLMQTRLRLLDLYSGSTADGSPAA